MKKYVRPELTVKSFVSRETIADGALDAFLAANNIDSTVGITTYQATSNGTFEHVPE